MIPKHVIAMMIHFRRVAIPQISIPSPAEKPGSSVCQEKSFMVSVELRVSSCEISAARRLLAGWARTPSPSVTGTDSERGKIPVYPQRAISAPS